MQTIIIKAAEPDYEGAEERGGVIQILPHPERLIHERSIMSENLEDLKRAFMKDASLIEHILWRSLPGGTYDHLFAKMAERKASLLIVSNDKF
jgi:hypothetical protein